MNLLTLRTMTLLLMQNYLEMSIFISEILNTVKIKLDQTIVLDLLKSSNQCF